MTDTSVLETDRLIPRAPALPARTHAYDTLGWSTAISLIDPENTASQKVATRLGTAIDKTYDHPEFGAMQNWRHPGPEALS